MAEAVDDRMGRASRRDFWIFLLVGWHASSIKVWMAASIGPLIDSLQPLHFVYADAADNKWPGELPFIVIRSDERRSDRLGWSPPRGDGQADPHPLFDHLHFDTQMPNP
jgi:hypothetical protein